MLIIAIIGTIITPLLAMLLTAMLSCEDNDINKLGTFIGIPLTVFMCLATMDSIIAAYKQITATKIESIDWSQVQVNEYRENDKVVKITYTIDGKTFELPIKEN